MNILSSLCVVLTQDTLFDFVEFQQGYHKKHFCAWWHIFNTFVPTCALDLRTAHGKNNICKCYTEGFIPIASLNGVVGLKYSFIRSLLDGTVKIWSYVYINTKWIYAPETLVCTISECAIVRKVIHVTSTCMFIYWCYGDANVKWIM